MSELSQAFHFFVLLFGVLDLTAFVTGAIHLKNAKEFCPWSPTLPAFLLIYGVIGLFLVRSLWLGIKSIDRKEEVSADTCITFALSSIATFGIVAWGTLY